jgi:hypothetical protein
MNTEWVPEIFDKALFGSCSVLITSTDVGPTFEPNAITGWFRIIPHILEYATYWHAHIKCINHNIQNGYGICDNVSNKRNKLWVQKLANGQARSLLQQAYTITK